MNRVQHFEELRPLLFAIAYRILGSVSEAEDAVQETWLRYERAAEEPESAKACRYACGGGLATSRGQLRAAVSSESWTCRGGAS